MPEITFFNGYFCTGFISRIIQIYICIKLNHIFVNLFCLWLYCNDVRLHDYSKPLFVSLHENNKWWDIELVQSIIVGLWKEWLSKYNYTIVTAEGNVMTILIGVLYEVVFLAYDLPWLFCFYITTFAVMVSCLVYKQTDQQQQRQLYESTNRLIWRWCVRFYV